MLNATLRRTRIVLAFSMMFILSVMAPASLAGNGDPVVVVDYVVDGSVVHVTVENLSHKAQTVEVHVYAVVDGVQVKGFTPVSLFSKGTVATVVGFSEAVDVVEVVGINEGGAPI